MQREYKTSSGNTYIIDVEEILDILFERNKEEVKAEARDTNSGKLEYDAFWYYLSDDYYDYWDVFREWVAKHNDAIKEHLYDDEDELAELVSEDEHNCIMSKYSDYVWPKVNTLEGELQRFQRHKNRIISGDLRTLEDKLYYAVSDIASFVGENASEMVRGYLNNTFGLEIPKAKACYVG